MDQNTGTPITQEYRDKVYEQLSQAMLSALDTGTITVEQSKEISQFVLDDLDLVKTQTELTNFLTELSNKWDIFKPVLLQLQEESQKNEKIEEITQNINQITNN